MAQYSYTYACGHGTGTVTLFGKNADRERKLSWYEQNMICPDCYKAKKSAEDEAAKAAAKPKYNGCFDFLKERHGADYAKRERAGGNPWNGKIYGKKGGYNYYVDDTRYSMTDEQQAAIIEYQTAMREWREKYK